MDNRDIPTWVCAHADGNESAPDTSRGVAYVRRMCTVPDRMGAMCARCLDNLAAFEAAWPFPDPKLPSACDWFTPKRVRGVNRL